MRSLAQEIASAPLQRIFRGLVLFWSVVIASIVAWDTWETYAVTLESARTTTIESFRKDVIYRRWASLHGGIYAPVTPQTPPNPDLVDLPERDIRTPSGKLLTLINPAYMTRQAHELGNKESGTKGHLTSLNPLRAANAPDDWESRALQAFERGEKERASLEKMGDETYFRFMRPLITEQSCMGCHAKQGYQVGSIRGGISAAAPWAPYRASMYAQIRSNVIGYALIWVLGILGLRLGRARLLEDLAARLRAQDALQASEQRLKLVVDQLETSNTELNLLNSKLAQFQGQLLQSEKLAAIGQLAAGVAHEINTPIGFVKSNLGALKNYMESLLGLVEVYERCSSPRSAQDEAALQAARNKADLNYVREDALVLLSESRDGLERMKKIVRGLRDFSRVDSAQWEDSDVMAGLESTLNVVNHTLGDKVEVLKHYGSLPLVRCNLAQINQVFMNLLLNAAQAIEDHGQITLSCGTDGPWVWISVEDTGQGMSPMVQKRIFEPFFTTKPVGQGTGLGLSLAYDSVQKHGGRIEVSSEPGHGSRFEIWLLIINPDRMAA